MHWHDHNTLFILTTWSSSIQFDSLWFLMMMLMCWNFSCCYRCWCWWGWCAWTLSLSLSLSLFLFRVLPAHLFIYITSRPISVCVHMMWAMCGLVISRILVFVVVNQSVTFACTHTHSQVNIIDEQVFIIITMITDWRYSDGAFYWCWR